MRALLSVLPTVHTQFKKSQIPFVLNSPLPACLFLTCVPSPPRNLPPTRERTVIFLCCLSNIEHTTPTGALCACLLGRCAHQPFAWDGGVSRDSASVPDSQFTGRARAHCPRRNPTEHWPHGGHEAALVELGHSRKSRFRSPRRFSW